MTDDAAREELDALIPLSLRSKIWEWRQRHSSHAPKAEKVCEENKKINVDTGKHIATIKVWLHE